MTRIHSVYLKPLLTSLILTILTVFKVEAEPLRILAIGNSFSNDAVETYLWGFLDARGIDSEVCNLYFPACSLGSHYHKLTTGSRDYEYRKVFDDKIHNRKEVSMEEVLRDGHWDIVTFQQNSKYSGQYETYAVLDKLLAAVRDITGPDTKFLWHMTWPYASYYSGSEFREYSKSSDKMYRQITECARQLLRDHSDIEGIIPAGTALMNLRKAYPTSDEYTRDGKHLSATGKYAAAATWCAVITGNDITDTKYKVKKVSSRMQTASKWAAAEAAAHPFGLYNDYVGVSDVAGTTNPLKCSISNGKVVISVSDGQSAQIRIYHIDGTLAADVTVTDYTSIDLSPGLYIVTPATAETTPLRIVVP